MAVNGYLFDTNILIDFGQRLYPLDIFPTLWNDLSDLIANDMVLLTSGCIQELKTKISDPEADRDNWRDWWIKHGFTYDHQKYQQTYATLVNKIMKDDRYYGNCGGAKRRHFLSKADPWLVSIAKQENLGIVTREGNGALQIPRICSLEGVEVLQLPEFMRMQQLSY